MKLFSHKYRYFFVLALGLYSYVNTLFVEAFKYYGIQAGAVSLIAGFVLICFLVWEGSRLVERMLLKYPRAAKLHPVLMLFILSQLIALLSGLLVYYIGRVYLLETGAANNPILLKLVLLFTFRVNLFLQCINAVTFFINRYQQKQIEAEELKRISTQAQLQGIRNQLNPHFLFNNLNVLSTLIMQKSGDANKFIEAFSSVYRYILRSRETETVRLQTELDFIEPYIYLLKTRFSSALNIITNIPEQYHNRLIAPGVLQLLIENAIKHNIVSSTNPLTVKLFTRDDGYLVVQNNLQMKPEKPPSTEFGLYNVSQQFKLLSGKEIKIDNQGGVFEVSIPLLEAPEITR